MKNTGTQNDGLPSGKRNQGLKPAVFFGGGSILSHTQMGFFSFVEGMSLGFEWKLKKQLRSLNERSQEPGPSNLEPF